ncbi:MAG: PQQ-binding-like beta-propeller repeat protein [Anaerolineales bacterium]|nr:PQQ-binding-like beta-propeller repeat protein [Anaerolineales bacterium]
MKWKQIIIFYMAMALNASCSIGYKPLCNPTEHNLEDSIFQPLWSRSDIFVLPNEYEPMIIGDSTRVFVAGLDSTHGLPFIFALDSQTGNVIWKQESEVSVSMLATSTNVFVGEIDRIKIYDPETGVLFRDTYIPVGIILLRYADEKNIYAVTGHGRWLTYDINSGQVDLSEPDVYLPLFIENGIEYRADFEGFKAVDAKTKVILWKYQLNEEINTQPIFLAQSIIFETGADNIYVLDKNEGTLIWRSQARIISNVAVDDSRVFFLTSEGRLSVLDVNTGSVIHSLEFSATPFQVSTADSSIGGYYVRMNPQTKELIVSLGDTCQVMAVEFDRP